MCGLLQPRCGAVLLECWRLPVLLHVNRRRHAMRGPQPGADPATGAQGLTATRDGLYTAGYLGVSPVLQQLLTESELTKGQNPTVIFVGAGMTAGLLAAALTQPVDTIKTRLQARTPPQSSPAGAHAASELPCRALEAPTEAEPAGLGALWPACKPAALGQAAILPSQQPTMRNSCRPLASLPVAHRMALVVPETRCMLAGGAGPADSW